MENGTLLERALQSPPGRSRPAVSDEQMLDMAVAYVTGAINGTQAGQALGVTRQAAFQRMMTQFVRGVRSGRVRVSVSNQAYGNGRASDGR